MKLVPLFLFLVLPFFITDAFAHHNAFALFDRSVRTQIVGVISDIRVVNPHSQVFLTVQDDEGQIEEWRIEAGPASAVRERGWNRENLPIGAKVTAEGYRARSGIRLLEFVSITFEDGSNF